MSHIHHIFQIAKVGSDQFFGHIKGSSAFYDFWKPYSK